MAELKFVLRNGTDAEWAASNRILLKGEPGFASTSKTLKFGDGVHTWGSLTGINGSGSASAPIFTTTLDGLVPRSVTTDGTKFLRDDGTWAVPAGGGGGGGGGSGSVTSVGLSLPNIFSVTNSPVTNSGVLTGTLATQATKTVLMGPVSGVDATPTFRTLTLTDLPSDARLNTFTTSTPGIVPASSVPEAILTGAGWDTSYLNLPQAAATSSGAFGQVVVASDGFYFALSNLTCWTDDFTSLPVMNLTGTATFTATDVGLAGGQVVPPTLTAKTLLTTDIGITVTDVGLTAKTEIYPISVSSGLLTSIANTETTTGVLVQNTDTTSITEISSTEVKTSKVTLSITGNSNAVTLAAAPNASYTLYLPNDAPADYSSFETLSIGAGEHLGRWVDTRDWNRISLNLPTTLAGYGISDGVTTSVTTLSSLVSVGTITTGVWNATAIADNKIASALTGKTYNALTLTANATGYSIAGGTTSKTLTVSNTLTLAGTDASTLNIGTGGTLGSAAFTSSSAYLSGNLTGVVTSVGTTTSIGAGAITNAMLANGAVANLSGTNSGDNAVNTLYSGLVSNATHTGDATGSTALTVVRINGVALSGLGTGILKNTTGTGVPSIAVAGDFPTLNQNTTGNAATVTTNANLTGHVTSVGNTASLGNFTKAQLDTAVSDGNVMYIGDAPTSHTHVSTDITDFSEAVDDRVGSLLVAGTNVTLNYNDAANTLTINATGGGGGTPGGSDTQIQFNNTGSFGGSSNLTWNGTVLAIAGTTTSTNIGVNTSTFDVTNPERLKVDNGASSSVNVISGYANINTYAQLNIKNTNAGTSASSDIVATANNGTESSNYVDLGINSSAWTSTTNVGSALDGYVYGNGNDFWVGAAGASKTLRFFVGGLDTTANERASITSSGVMKINNLTGAGTRMVVSDSSGNLSTQAIPGGGSGATNAFAIAMAIVL